MKTLVDVDKKGWITNCRFVSDRHLFNPQNAAKSGFTGLKKKTCITPPAGGAQRWYSKIELFEMFFDVIPKKKKGLTSRADTNCNGLSAVFMSGMLDSRS